jgi:hypothetical protein
MKVLLTIILLSLSALPVLAGEDCTCSHKGNKVLEGQQACLKTPKGMQMALCSRVLNNTSWKFLGTPCPTAHLKKENNQSVFDYEKSISSLKKSG